MRQVEIDYTLMVSVGSVPGVDLGENEETPGCGHWNHFHLKTQVFVEIAADNQQGWEGYKDHGEAEIEPFLEDSNLYFFSIVTNRLTLVMHLVQCLVDALLSCIPYPSQACLAENGLEGEEDPETVEFRLFNLLKNLLRRHGQANCFDRPEVLAYFY